jgi:DNA-binding MarR family transcriptional regulator
MPKPTKGDYARAARLREALALFLRVSEKITRAHGLTLPRYQLLLMVKTARDGNERASLPELQERLQLAQSSVVELVQRAESHGLVERKLSSANRRLTYVALTSEGERRLAATIVDLTRARRDLHASLSGVIEPD